MQPRHVYVKMTQIVIIKYDIASLKTKIKLDQPRRFHSYNLFMGHLCIGTHGKTVSL